MEHFPKNMREAVLATLAWFDVFDFPLTLDEIHNYLFGFEATKEQVKTYIDGTEKIASRQGFYCLKGRGKIIDIRGERQNIVLSLWKKVDYYVPILKFVPFVRMVGVCNTLAFQQASEESDIDLFIVAKHGRLFTVRFLITLLFQFLGIRRHGNRIASRFCLSFYVTDEHLNLENVALRPDDIYLAYWIKTLKIILGEETYRHFLWANSWMKRHFPQGVSVDLSKFQREGRASRLIKWLLEKILSTRVGHILEQRLMRMQIARAKKKRSQFGPEASILVGDSILKFHNIDRRAEYRNMFFERYKKLIA